MNIKKCTNCGNEFTEEQCPKCGYNTNVKKHTKTELQIKITKNDLLIQRLHYLLIKNLYHWKKT